MYEQPGQPVLAKRLALGEGEEAARYVVPHVVQVGVHGVGAAPEVEVVREKEARGVAQLLGDVQPQQEEGLPMGKGRGGGEGIREGGKSQWRQGSGGLYAACRSGVVRHGPFHSSSRHIPLPLMHRPALTLHAFQKSCVGLLQNLHRPVASSYAQTAKQFTETQRQSKLACTEAPAVVP